MIFHQNRLLADDSHEISYLIFVENYIGKMLQNLSSSAVVIGTLRVKRNNCTLYNKMNLEPSGIQDKYKICKVYIFACIMLML